MQRTVNNNSDKAQRVLVALLIVILAFCVVACDAERDFTLSCSLSDGMVVNEGNIEFVATAYFKNKSCDFVVSVNGTAIDKSDDGRYTATLEEGDNTIVLTATSGNNKSERNYIVRYEKKEMTIYTNISEKKIVNDVLYFNARALYGEEPCGVTVLYNGTVLEPTNDLFAASLKKGENTFDFIARKGDVILQKTENVDYAGFRINTDLQETETDESTLSFRAAGAYGNELCDIEATVNGEKVVGTGNKYEYEFVEDGEYTIVLVASKDEMVFKKEYVISYCDKDPYFDLFTLENDKTFKGDRATFDVSAKNGLGKKIDDSDISFFADFDADDGVENFVSLNAQEIQKVWSDKVKTSYRLNFEKGRYKNALSTATILRARITYNDKTIDKDVRITYVGADPDGCVGKTVLSIEGFTIDCGYIMNPTEVKIFKGVNYARYLCAEIEKNGWTYTNTGTLDSGFYLAQICGLSLENNRINADLLKIMQEKGLSLFNESISPKDGKYTLGEFDFASGSGWMYSVNGSFPNYGFADYYPQDGDVVRVQFTLCLGSDLGGSDAVGFGGNNYNTNNADYKAIHTLIAGIIANGFFGKDEMTLNASLEKIAVWNVSQSVLNEETSKLKECYYD